MASTKLSQSLAALPDPPKENLTSHFTLGEIINHIANIQDEFPHVKIPLLRSHLWDIRNKNVNPESHLRGFLQVFEHTDIYKSMFEELDDGMKKQIKTFINGGREGVVLAAGGKEDAFHLPPSPPVKMHFCGLRERLERLLQHEHKSEPGDEAKRHTDGHTNGPTAKRIEIETSDGHPRIFEDKTETKTMEVSLYI
jgi:hypothetical protein